MRGVFIENYYFLNMNLLCLSPSIPRHTDKNFHCFLFMGATRMFIRLWILNIRFAAKEARFAAGEENTSTIPGKKVYVLFNNAF
jgi:hypothetical protein